ncbi:hypothetical protein NEFER03_2192 [Nematocida sp. LUAm3]|nr:hypothetical protein NEFER03_2192 [Nematocida sp. LUAm3]KAI5176300.1 hypothetical protein NEFER02_2092 [Nematocida sp. LUAm2]KAI5179228.1 hypothetical protein NEFER01_2082 [Nematocida sp. LUAm1]
MHEKLYEELKKRIVLIYKKEEDLPEEEEIDAICVEGRESLEESICSYYKIDTLPIVIAYGEPYKLQELSRVKEIKRQEEEKELDSAIETIKREKRVIFIKGTPQAPQCRFTRQLIDLLKEEGILYSDYTSINILESDAIREGLKEYSDWPTYPQVYVNGELLGGLDVLKAEKAKGNLSKLLNA